MPAMSDAPRIVTLELTKDLQEDFESWLAVCDSFGINPRINSFLHYVNNFGTNAQPKETTWE